MKLFIIFFIYIALAYGKHKQGYFPKCRRSDPQIEKCILDGIEKIRPMIKEPFKISHLYASSSSGAAKDIRAYFRNIKARRFTDFRIEELKVDLHNKHQYTGKLKVILPHLDLSGDYTAQKSVFGLKFKSYGQFKGFFKNIVVQATSAASPTTKHGVEYLTLNDVTTNIQIGDANLEVKPSDNSFIGRKIASYVHSDPQGALQMVAPAINENVARMVKKFLNKLLARVPLKDLIRD